MTRSGMPRRTRLTQTRSVAKSQLHRTRGIGGIQWCRCDRNSNGIREFFGIFVECSWTGGWVEAFRKRVCKCCRPFFPRYFPPSKFGSNVGCHDWARAITTCNKEDRKWLEKTIRNEDNTTSSPRKTSYPSDTADTPTTKQPLPYCSNTPCLCNCLGFSNSN